MAREAPVSRKEMRLRLGDHGLRFYFGLCHKSALTLDEPCHIPGLQPVYNNDWAGLEDAVVKILF